MAKLRNEKEQTCLYPGYSCRPDCLGNLIYKLVRFGNTDYMILVAGVLLSLWERQHISEQRSDYSIVTQTTIERKVYWHLSL